MLKKKNILWFLILGSFIFQSPAYSDESSLFISVAPDSLMVLDLSGSMRWTPAGERMYTLTGGSCDSTSNPFYGESSPTYAKACNIDPYGSVPKYSNDSCSGPFYRNPGSGHNTDCSRVMIARRALFDILDDNGSSNIDSQDEKSLGIRIGFMRFYNCQGHETGDYSSGCNKLMASIATPYTTLWNGSGSWSGINGTTTASGGTALSGALNEAKLYLDAHKANDNAAACRPKFVILITDGADTYACGGSGNEDQQDQYKRRRQTVAKAKALADAGYKVFVVGFGADMPHWLRNTLNWAAYYAGTDNPLLENTGDPNAYDPSSVISCQASTTDHHNISGEGDHYYATANDPGEIPLSGYAFLASNADELSAALKQAINIISEATYSFSLASIASSRTQDENNIYETSFRPLNNDPFWLGYLKKYNINSDGTIGGVVWDAGSVLQNTAPASRNIYTYKSGALTPFTAANITRGDLGASSDSARDAIVGYLRGDPAYNPDNWKLGDILHSNPVTIGAPSTFFIDGQDANNAFDTFRANHQRTSANGQKAILAGANDGQIHTFRTSDGAEVWSFIPPNFLPKLKNIAHATHPTRLSHQFFVDGPVAAADVWVGSGDGTHKNDTDWITLLIFGEGRGGGATLWSSSASCDSGFNPRYTSAYPNYCGYYVLDVTTATSPIYKWRINPNSLQAPYLGDPWSKISFGKVKINGGEKWVGLLGGGYNAADCAGSGDCDSRGKGFYVVDLVSGNILWSYTRADNPSMNYSFPASPAAVDTDNDGFIDIVYLGDLGGNMWRFKFCSKMDGPTCNTANWNGGVLFQSSAGVIRPIYTMASIAKDFNGIVWVYWGTGDKTDPTAANVQEKFFAVKDNDRTSTYQISDLDNISLSEYSDSYEKHGWYINLPGVGEKMLAEPTVFGGIVYFTTYTPPNASDPCEQGGTATLYGLKYITAAGALMESGGSGRPPGGPVRTINIGIGIPTAPVISFKPRGVLPPDLYVTVSGGGGQDESTKRLNFDPTTLSNRTNILTWKDRRLQ